MMKFRLVFILSALLALGGCGEEKKGVAETRTSGTLTMLVDHSVAPLIDQQIQVFRSDYPDATITVVKGEEGQILPTFLNDTTRMIVMARKLTPEELKFYERRKIPVNVDRIAIDGITLIASKNTIDSNITVEEVIDILKGKSADKRLVFDNPYSSTIRYFKERAGVASFPASGVFTLRNAGEVLDYVAANRNYIGVVGLNWILENTQLAEKKGIMLMNVKNEVGKRGSETFYKPSQGNIMSGIYPFFREIFVVNAEGRDGLGTGFATWLTSARGQLIVLRSGLGPDSEIPREINLINKK